MVQAREIPLDELILQTFEEQDDAFCFPVKSQKDAKAFVRALNIKGLPYECLCHEIGELEHNFTSWRKSLGRIGIGQRVIERINRPLQTLLDEDDLFMPTSSHFNYNSSSNNTAYNNHTSRARKTSLSSADEDSASDSVASDSSKSDTPPPSPQHRESTEEPPHTRTNTAQDLHKSHLDTTKKPPETPASNKSAKNAPITQPVSTTKSEAVKVNPIVTQPAPNKPQEDSSDSDTEVKMSVAERISAYNSGSPSPTRKHRDTAQRDTPQRDTPPKDVEVTKEPMASEETLVVEQAKGHVHTHSLVSRFEQMTTPGAGAHDYHESDNADNTPETTSEAQLSPTSENATKPEASTSPVMINKDGKETNGVGPTEEECSQTSMETQNPEEEKVKSISERMAELKKGMSGGKHKTPAPLDIKNEEEICSAGEAKHNDSQREPTVLSPTNKGDPEVAAPITETSTEAPARSPDAEGKKRILELRKGSLDTRKDHLESQKVEDVRKGSLFDVNSVSLDDSAALIDENYNSDLDPENQDQSPVMAKLVQKISAMRSNTKNTAGYIYMFTDSAEGLNNIRVKIGASRCPNKRLQQAQLFNPEIRLLESGAVSQRLSALSDMNEQLTNITCEGLGNWYEGSKEQFVACLQSVTEKYPSKIMKQSSESTC